MDPLRQTGGAGGGIRLASVAGMTPTTRGSAAGTLLVSLVFTLACGPTVYKPRLQDPSHPPPFDEKSEPLKVHLRSGDLVVLDSWRLTPEGASLVGNGRRYDAWRRIDTTGPQSVPREEIVLLETNDRRHVSSLAVAGLSTLTVLFGTVSAVCLADPKSCFGSCPTFYAENDNRRPLAEGFSASIARVLEAKDVDALPDLEARGGRLVLSMRNEALETHAVRRVRLLAVPRPAGARVVATRDGAFHVLERLVPPLACRAFEGDCRDELAREDGRERRSSTDPEDLAAREELYLDFPATSARTGLVIRARQSLLSTFLFYQTLAYMGRHAGEWLAALERGGREEAEQAVSMGRLLGGIEVAVTDPVGRWTVAGSFDEAGPISGDTQLIALPPPRLSGGPLRVRLRMAKGHWRLDHVALGELGGARADPQALGLVAVDRDGKPDPDALRALESGERHLITLPGDEYRLTFSHAGDARTTELFLESEGYYYEWMRAEWLAEEDPAMLALAVTRPEEALRRLAAPWKAREAGAERTFWNSRFRR
jgi:hypothetical protein